MEKDIKKKQASDINEELMMNLMVDGIKKEGLKPAKELTIQQIEETSSSSTEELPNKTKLKENRKSKRRTETDYEAIFFQKSETQARDGKTVYIRPDFHEKLTRIVQVIGEDKISIYAYLDNILEYHFQQFGDAITKSYNEKYKPIL